MTILIDFDDVLNNLCETWIQILNEKHNLLVKHTDIKEWDMTKAFPTLTTDELYAPLFTKELWGRIKPNNDAKEYLIKFINEGHKVYIVTAAHPYTISMKYNFIQKFYPFIDSKQIITTCNKQMIKGDVLIDDAPHNLIGGDYIGILFSQPHNQSFDVQKHSNIIRVNSWNEIEQQINSLKSK